MKKMLVFQHIEREHLSNIAEYAKERGMALDIVELWKENIRMPELSGYDALIVLGGPMGVYEEYPNKLEELRVLERAVGMMPILGICLGAQLLAHALGARVYPWEYEGRRRKEIGYYEVSLTDEGTSGKFFKDFPPSFTVLQWHGDTFDIPAGAKLLVSGDECRNQAFSYGNACGVQFHVEATPEIVADWVREDATWIHDGFAMDEEKVRREAEALRGEMKSHCFRLMDNFLSV